MVTKGVSTKDGALTEQFFGQVSESLQLVFDLTSRIDERVKMIIEKQKELDDQVQKLIYRDSISFACCLVVSVSSMPPSIRAISSTRLIESSRSIELNVTPFR